ncbi:MAG TPA: RNA polymerase sigma factor [Polyangiaceae bacterium]|nr:RNA polymerase sigma factor [Polyangiaceae bacterium]
MTASTLPLAPLLGAAERNGGSSWAMVRRMLPKAGESADADRAKELEVERVLVERAQAGDRRAMGELLHRHGAVLYATVLLPRLGNEAAAKDALAETYAKVVERIDRFRWQNVGFYPWLRTVALRIAIDSLRARKRTVLWDAEDIEREVDASESSTPIDVAVQERRDREEAKARLGQALDAIHPRYARALRMRILEERPREEVAAELGVTPATFDVLLHRATAALRKVLHKEPSDEK